MSSESALFNPEDLQPVFQRLSEGGWDCLLVGGQALNVLAAHYRIDGRLAPFVSEDLDYVGGREIEEDVAGAVSDQQRIRTLSQRRRARYAVAWQKAANRCPELHRRNRCRGSGGQRDDSFTGVFRRFMALARAASPPQLKALPKPPLPGLGGGSMGKEPLI